MTYKLFSALTQPTKKHNQISAEQARYYLADQGDPIAGHQTGRLRVVEKQEHWSIESSLPIALHIPKFAPELALDWDKMPEREAQGHALWKISLSFLPGLLEASNDFDLVETILDSAWEYNLSEKWKERSAWMTSLDHMLAVRIRVLCTLCCRYILAQRNLPETVYKLYINDIENLRHNPDEYIPANNHGAMVAIAVLHSAAIFGKQTTPDSGSSDSSQHELDQFGWTHLAKVLGSMFDEYGIAAENSPEYQRYWISLLSPVKAFLEAFPEMKQSAAQTLDLSMILEQAETALAYFTDSHSRLIPIGDTHPRKITIKSAPAKSFLVSEQSGFAIYKEDSTIFTFNSGSTNYAHKHCDDLSITLEYGGVQLLLDAGYYSHDWNDPKAIFTKSQNAHSGLFLTELDNLHPGKLYWPGAQRVVAQMSDNSTSNTFKVIGRAEVDQKARLERKVEFVSPKHLLIEDSVVAAPQIYGIAVQRFILPIGTNLQVHGNTVSAAIGPVTMDMIFSGRQLEDLNLSIAQDDPEYKGWISPELNQLEPALALDVPVAAGASATVDIFLDHGV